MRFDMKVRIAILDMYEGFANQGMRGIKEIITNWGVAHHCDISYEVFDVRLKTSYPTYLMTHISQLAGPEARWTARAKPGIPTSYIG